MHRISAAAATTDAAEDVDCSANIVAMQLQSVAKDAQAVVKAVHVVMVAHNVDTKFSTSAIAAQNADADFSDMVTDVRADVATGCSVMVKAKAMSTHRNADQCTAQLLILTTQHAAHATS